MPINQKSTSFVNNSNNISDLYTINFKAFVMSKQFSKSFVGAFVLSMLFFHSSIAQIKLWSHHAGDTSVNGDFADEIRFDQNGNSIVVGSFHGTLQLDPSNLATSLTSVGSKDGFIAKYDPNGTLLFQKKITGPSYESIYAMDLDASGNIFITGTFASTMDLDPNNAVASFTSYGNSSDIFIAKYDPLGNYVWGRSMGSNGNTDNGLDLCVDAQGNVLVTGHFTGSMSFAIGVAAASKTSLGGMDAFVLKLDNNGVFKWVNTIGSAPHWERGKKIKCDANGNVFLVGEFSSVIDIDPTAGVMNITPVNVGNNDYFFIKYDANGVPQWGRATSIEPNICIHNNSIYLAAYAQDSVDYDLGSGNFYLPVSTYYKMSVAKYDQNLQLIWAKQFQDSAYSSISHLQFDQNNNIVIAGEFSDHDNTGFDFDLSSNSQLINADTNSIYDFFVARYDSNMNFMNVMHFPQSNYGFITSQDIDQNNNIAICGYFKDTLDLDPSANSSIAISKGDFDMFCGKYSFTAPTSMEDLATDKDILIFPNPAHDILNVETDDIGQFTIINIMGQKVKQGIIEKSINLSGLNNGLYTLSIGEKRVRFIKQ